MATPGTGAAEPGVGARPLSPAIGVAAQAAAARRAQGGARGNNAESGDGRGHQAVQRGRPTARRRKVRSAGVCELCRKEHRHTHHLPIDGVVRALRVTDWSPVNMDVCGSCWKWANRHFGGQHKRCAVKPSKACERHLLEADEAGVRLVASAPTARDGAQGTPASVPDAAGGVTIPVPLWPPPLQHSASGDAPMSSPTEGDPRGTHRHDQADAMPPGGRDMLRHHRRTGSGARAGHGTPAFVSGVGRGAGAERDTSAAAGGGAAMPSAAAGAAAGGSGLDAASGDESAMSRYSNKDMLLDLMRDLRKFGGGGAGVPGPIRSDTSFAGASEIVGGVPWGGSVSRAPSEPDSDWAMGVASVRGADSRRGSVGTAAPLQAWVPITRRRRGSGSSIGAGSRRRSVSSGRASVRTSTNFPMSVSRAGTPQSWLTLSDLAQFNFPLAGSTTGASVGQHTPQVARRAAVGTGAVPASGATAAGAGRPPTPSLAGGAAGRRSRSLSPSVSRASRMSYDSMGLDSLLELGAHGAASEAGMSLVASISGLSVSGTRSGRARTGRSGGGRGGTPQRAPSVAQSVFSTFSAARTDLMAMSTFSFPTRAGDTGPDGVLDPLVSGPSDAWGDSASMMDYSVAGSVARPPAGSRSRGASGGSAAALGMGGFLDGSVTPSFGAPPFSTGSMYGASRGPPHLDTDADSVDTAALFESLGNTAFGGGTGRSGASTGLGTATPNRYDSDGLGAGRGRSPARDGGARQALFRTASGSSARLATPTPGAGGQPSADSGAPGWPPANPRSGGQPRTYKPAAAGVVQPPTARHRDGAGNGGGGARAPPPSSVGQQRRQQQQQQQQQQGFRQGPSRVRPQQVVLPTGLVRSAHGARPPAAQRRAAVAGASQRVHVVGRPQPGRTGGDGTPEGDDHAHDIDLTKAIPLSGPLFAAQRRLEAQERERARRQREQARETRRRLQRLQQTADQAAARRATVGQARRLNLPQKRVTADGAGFADGSQLSMDSVGVFRGISSLARLSEEPDGGGMSRDSGSEGDLSPAADPGDRATSSAGVADAGMEDDVMLLTGDSDPLMSSRTTLSFFKSMGSTGSAAVEAAGAPAPAARE